MTTYSPETVEVQEMFGAIASKYDITNTVLSFGMHHLWKKRLVRMSPQSRDLKGLDLCTGTGDMLPLLSEKLGSVVGADFCEPMLEVGRKKFKAEGRHFDLIQADAHDLPFPDQSFDVVSVSFGVRNFRDLRKGLSEIFRVLKPSGTLLILEFGQPQGFFFGPLYRFYSKYIIPLIGGLLTGSRHAYTYLPEPSKNFPCGPRLCTILNELGFATSSCSPLTFGIAYIYSATKSAQNRL